MHQALFQTVGTLQCNKGPCLREAYNLMGGAQQYTTNVIAEKLLQCFGSGEMLWALGTKSAMDTSGVWGSGRK